MKYFILSLLLVVLTAANVSAATVTIIRTDVTIVTPDDYNTHTLNVTTSNKWLAAELLVTLGAGDIYQNADVPSDGPPTPTNVGTFPLLQYDTYLTGGLDTGASQGTPPNVFGGAVDINPNSTIAADKGGIPAVLSSTRVDATWASSLATSPTGSLMLARVTLSDTAQGVYSYMVSEKNAARADLQAGFIVDGVMEDVVIKTGFLMDESLPGLAGFVSNRWQVNTLGKTFLAAEMDIDLTAGSVHQNTAYPSDVPPTPANILLDPTLEYDTYMAVGRDTYTVAQGYVPAQGTVPTVYGGAVDIGGGIPLVFDTTGVDATWSPTGPPENNPSGQELTLARFTLSDDATGTYKFRVEIDANNPVIFMAGTIVGGKMAGIHLIPNSPSGRTLMPGDTDYDFVVDAIDAATLAAYWQKTGLTLGPSEGDFNGDGTANDVDAVILAANWTPPPVTAAVPEPSTAMLLLAGLAMLSVCLGRRRR